MIYELLMSEYYTLTLSTVAYNPTQERNGYLHLSSLLTIGYNGIPESSKHGFFVAFCDIESAVSLL